jgi:hypothetical protein
VLICKIRKTEILKKKWGNSRRTVKVVKEIVIDRYKKMITPFRGRHIVLDKYGYFVSDRKNITISKETEKTVVFNGIHVYELNEDSKKWTRLSSIEDRKKGIFGKDSFSILLLLEARKKDFIAAGNNDLVFDKIKFPKETIKELKKQGIKIDRKL